MQLAVVQACPTVFVRPTGNHGWNYHNSIVGRVLPCIDGDPLMDLNAMHEAIKIQPPHVRKAMRFWLNTIRDEMSAHEATAAQMAKALLCARREYRFEN